MYIYVITNTINDKMYIGQTVQKNPKMRWYAHQYDARTGKKTHLNDSIRKYGVDNFTWEIIDQTDTLDKLNDLEDKWLNHYRVLTEVYNVREAGGNMLHSTESIEKMRESQRLAHARRRANGTEGGWTRRDGGPMKGKTHPGKGKKYGPRSEEVLKKNHQKICDANTKKFKGKTWKMIEGKRVWMEK